MAERISARRAPSFPPNPRHWTLDTFGNPDRRPPARTTNPTKEKKT